MHICVFSFVSVCLTAQRLQKMDSQASRPLMLKAKQHDEHGETPSAGNQEHPPPSWWAPSLLSVILQSIRKRNRNGEHAACSAWDSSWYAWRPQIQSYKAARVARNSLANCGSLPSGQSSTTVLTDLDVHTSEQCTKSWINYCLHLCKKKGIYIYEMENDSYIYTHIYIGLFYLRRTKGFTKSLIHPRTPTLGRSLWEKNVIEE